jgi:nucleoid-associated protein YgaU
MGLFNFIKDVGQKLLGGDTTPAAANAENTAQILQQHLQSLNLGIENLNVRLEGDTAIVEGNAASQEALEKAVLAIGNTTGIAQVDSRIEAPAAPQSNFYTVQKGDTLSKIAKQEYGDANRYNEIFEANRPLLKNADAIYPGQQLRIPQAIKAAA